MKTLLETLADCLIVLMVFLLGYLLLIITP